MSDYVNRFVPAVMQSNDEMNSLYEVQADEIKRLNGGIKLVTDNCFIISCDVNGISRLEKICGLTGNSSLTLEQRKESLLNKLRFKPPFTRQGFMRILESVWGKGNYTFMIYPNFELIIDIYTTNYFIYIQFQKYLRDVVPANVYIIYSIQYIYLYLMRNYTYNRLESENLTYGELSRYA